jgi:hypothetical protein
MMICFIRIPHVTDILTRGGMRGIVESEALQFLERALNGGSGSLLIQSFFDLVVDTRLVLLVTSD